MMKMPFPTTEEGTWVAATDVVTMVVVGFVTGQWDAVLMMAVPQLFIGVAWQLRHARAGKLQSAEDSDI